MKIDYFNLFSTILFIDTVILLVLIYYIISTNSKKWIITSYMIYKTLEVITLVGFALRSSFSDILTINLTNALLFLTYYVHLITIVSFKGKLQKKFAFYLGGVTIIFIIVYLILIDNHRYAAIFGASYTMIIFSAGGIYLFAKREFYKLPILISSVFMLNSITHLGRVIFLLTSSDAYSFLNLVPWDIIPIFSTLAVIVVSPLGFLLLIKEVDDKNLDWQNRLTSIAFTESPVSIVLTDPEGIIQFVNPKFSELTGYTSVEVVGQNPNLLKTNLTPPETYEDLWKTIMADKTWQGVFINKKKNGETYIEEATIVPIKDEKSKLSNILAIKTDITQRKEYENIIKKRNEELLELNNELKQLNNTKDKLLSIIGHDLKGPIGNIRQLLYLISLELETGNLEGVPEILSMSRESADMSFELLENLLNWSRSQLNTVKPEPEHIYLRGLIKKTCQLYQPALSKKNIKIECQVDQDYYAFADLNMLSTIIRNLISNAVKFTPETGEIIIDSKLEDEFVTISVSDSGIGIEADRLDKIFDFSENTTTVGTAGEKGTGLGLSVVKDFVSRNSGRIWVESEFGIGSKFYVSVPKGISKNTP